MSIIKYIFMMDTQAIGWVSNSAANPLSVPKPRKNSAAGRLGKIVLKALICWRFLTFRGALLRDRGVFLPAVRDRRRSEPRRPLRRAGAGHAPGRVEPDAAKATEELGQGQPVGQRQRRRQERGDVGPQVVRVAGPEEHNIDPRLVPREAVGGLGDGARSRFMEQEAERVAGI